MLLDIPYSKIYVTVWWGRYVCAYALIARYVPGMTSKSDKCLSLFWLSTFNHFRGSSPNMLLYLLWRLRVIEWYVNLYCYIQSQLKHSHHNNPNFFNSILVENLKFIFFWNFTLSVLNLQRRCTIFVT